MRNYGREYILSKYMPPPTFILTCCIASLLLFVTSSCSTNSWKTDSFPGGTKIGYGPIGDPTREVKEKTCEIDLTGAGLTQKILATAYSQYGKPYRFGGNSPQTGFDCAGFVQWVYGQHGIKLPRMSTEQIHVGTPVNRADLKPGDLVFFYEWRSCHVGIYVGDGKFIDSPRTGFRIGEMEAFDSYHNACFAGARRVHKDPAPESLSAEMRQAIIATAISTNAPGLKVDPKRTGPVMVASNIPARQQAQTSRLTLVRTPADLAASQRRNQMVGRARIEPQVKAKDTVAMVNGQRQAINNKPQANKVGGPVQTASSKAVTNQRAASYQIKNGDTICGVAQRLGVTPDALRHANGLAGSPTLRIGQTLNIPAKGKI